MSSSSANNDNNSSSSSSSSNASNVSSSSGSSGSSNTPGKTDTYTMKDINNALKKMNDARLSKEVCEQHCGNNCLTCKYKKNRDIGKFLVEPLTYFEYIKYLMADLLTRFFSIIKELDIYSHVSYRLYGFNPGFFMCIICLLILLVFLLEIDQIPTVSAMWTYVKGTAQKVSQYSN